MSDINYHNKSEVKKRCEQNYIKKPQRARMNGKFKYKLTGREQKGLGIILNDASGLHFLV